MDNQFLSEIMSQPDAIQTCFDHYKANNYELIEILYNKFYNIHNQKSGHPIKKIIFIGMGSSNFAALIGYYYLNSPVVREKTRISCEIWDGGEFLYHTKIDRYDDDTLIILISQSGESGEMVEILKKLEADNFPKNNIWAITNTENSSLHKCSGHTLFLYAGKESSVTNKTYFCTLLVVYILSQVIEKSVHFELNHPAIENMFTELGNKLKILLNDVNDLLKNWKNISKYLIKFFILDTKCVNLYEKVPKFIDCIGKGTSLSTTNQGALNIKEVAKIYSESISASMFRHGPIEIIDECFRAIILSNNDKDRESINGLIRNIANSWGGKLFLITNSRDQVTEFEENKNILILYHSTTDPFLAPMYEIIPIQILYYNLAELKGITPGTFKFTSKVTKDF